MQKKQLSNSGKSMNGETHIIILLY